MSIYFNTKKRRKLFKRVLYNLGILLCKSPDVKDYLFFVGRLNFIFLPRSV